MAEEPKKLLVTADLHFGLYPTGDACVQRLAEHVRQSDADVFIIAGDIADADTDYFAACLDLFATFKGVKLMVPGNHDLWTAGVGSQKKYSDVLPSIATDCGFRMLDAGPVRISGVGFIGSIGWYDYSFRNPELNVHLEQYKKKELPGVCIWNDVKFIDWDMSDEEFTEKCLRRLTAAYRSIEPQVHTVVAVLHHVPFKEMLYGSSSAAFEFCRAYMGSERLGRLLTDCRKIRYALCGHQHSEGHCKTGKVEAIAVGSEYLFKRLIELDLDTGEHTSLLFEPPAEDPHKVTTAFLPD